MRSNAGMANRQGDVGLRAPVNTSTLLGLANLVILHTYLTMKMEQCVPKRRHIKFRCWGIIQKKAYNNADMAVSCKC